MHHPFKPAAAAVAYFALIVFCSLSIIHFYYANQFTKANAIDFQDTQIFVEAAIEWQKTNYLYLFSTEEPLNLKYRPGAAVFKFPPIYVLPYIPWLDAIQTSLKTSLYSALYNIHIFRYIFTALLISWMFGADKNLKRTMIFISIFCLASPALECLNGMTFENIFLFLITIAMILTIKNRNYAASAILSYLALAKIYPVYLLVYFFTKKHASTIVKIIITASIWMLISIAVIGIESHVDFYTEILPVLLKENAKIGWVNTSIIPTLIENKSIQKTTMFCVAIASIITLNICSDTEKNQQLKFALCSTLPLLLIKNVWVSYQIILLLPICILIGQGMQEKNKLGIAKIIVASAAFLPLLTSKNYPGLGLPYYPWLESTAWFTPFSEALHDMRIYSAAILWAGILSIILIENIKIKSRIIYETKT